MESGGAAAEIVDTSQDSDMSPTTTGWECSGCTFVNPKAKRKCGMCQAPRPSASTLRGRGTKRSRQGG